MERRSEKEAADARDGSLLAKESSRTLVKERHGQEEKPRWNARGEARERPRVETPTTP